ncbi:MAG: flagellar basal body M-ring protein FliF, partial [Actinobacteria bacterium]|nr:flagellar basal body M-ring protein FliF [Actinomycetota bacterium]
MSLLLTFAAVVGLIVGAAYWITTPSYRILFSDLDPESAASVVDDLEASQIRYTLDPGGRTVRVPASQLDALRLRFASEGLPSSGRIGFEIFDRTAFGATEFLEQVNLRRALEG